MKKIVILGANSYIARNVIYMLKKSNEEIELKLYDINETQMDGEQQYQQIDVLSETSMGKLDLDCDIIFMFVGKTGSADGFDDYNKFIDINEVALLNLLNEYRKQNSSAKIIFPSTRLVYKGKKGLQKENDEKEFKTIYAINKFACEQYLEQFNRVFGIQYCIFRICVPYGTLIANASSYGTAEFMLNKAKKGEKIVLYGEGKVRRTLTYMGDLCDTLIKGAFSPECLNDVYNIGGEDYSLREMAELIAHKYQVGIDYVEWPKVAAEIESGDTVFNSQKLERIIGKTVSSKFTDWIL